MFLSERRFFSAFVSAKAAKPLGAANSHELCHFSCPRRLRNTTPLPGCGARSDERIALRTTELLRAVVSMQHLHAARVQAQTGAAPGKTRSRNTFHLQTLKGTLCEYSFENYCLTCFAQRVSICHIFEFRDYSDNARIYITPQARLSAGRTRNSPAQECAR